MSLRPSLLYLQCASGASGDMLTAALLALAASSAAEAARADAEAAQADDGAGAAGQAADPAEALDRVVRPALAAAGIDPAVAHVTPVVRGGLAAWHFTVDDRPGFATFSELVAAVRASTLDPSVAAGVVAVAERMAAAERAVHGGVDEHLHELASLDTAVDLISVTALVAALAPERVVASPPALGGGSVRTAHGELPVPVPAVLALLHGLPTAGADWDGPPAELTTPTGAALLAHLVSEFGGLPAGRLHATGLGAGRRELEGRPNVLRALLVEPPDRSPGHAGPWAEDEVELLEATIDDLPAELLAEAAGRLLEAGALDVWSTPATMKKSRPGTVLHVLARPAQRAALAAIVFTETSTFGLRVAATRRLLLDERRTTVSVDGETVHVRLGYLGHRLVTASPEYEDCRTAAASSGRPAKDLYDRARALARGLERP